MKIMLCAGSGTAQRKTPASRAEGTCRTLVCLSKMHTHQRQTCLGILRSLKLPVSSSAL